MSILKYFRRSRRFRVVPLIAEMAKDDLKAWRVVTLENVEKGEKWVFRIRITKPVHPDIDLLTTAVVIRWPYHSDSSMPIKADNERQLAFERAIDPLTCENDNSEIVQVTTGMGQKEWVFYSCNRVVFMKRLNDLLSSFPTCPIAVEFYDDQDWKVWADVVDRLREKLA